MTLIHVPTQTLDQAILKIQKMPATKRNEIFDFIDFIESREKNTAQSAQALTGAVLVKLFADVKLSDTEVATFDYICQDDDSEPVSFD